MDKYGLLFKGLNRSGDWRRYLVAGVFVLAMATFSCTKTDNLYPIHAPEAGQQDGDGQGAPEPVDEPAYAFPGAEGAGKLTTGGRGGRVIKVTNLNDAGEGSLRAAVEATGKRIVIFEVSGNIKLKSRLRISNGDITIAGQTAPGDGICIQDHEVNISADNVIVRYMRFRLGDTYVASIESDAFWGRDLQNVVIDHCSMSWSIDETASFYHNKNFTMQWSMITESMTHSGHSKGDHGYGGIWGGAPASFHHNLIADHTSRNPRFDGGLRYSNGSGTQVGQFGPDRLDFRNNVIFNWAGNSSYGGENGQYNIVNNYFKAGPATPSSSRYRITQVSKDNAGSAPDPSIFGKGYGTYFIEGNYVDGSSEVTADNWKGVIYDNGVNEGLARLTEPVEIEPIPVHTAEQAYEAVLNYAGASLSRDAVDARIVNDVRTGAPAFMGWYTKKPGIIDNQDDVGGWPELKSLPAPVDTDGDGMPDDWELSVGLDPNIANPNGKNLSLAYDNIEVYINSLVSEITSGQQQ